MDADRPDGKKPAQDSVPTAQGTENGFGPNFDWSNFEKTNKLQDQVEQLQKDLVEKLEENEQLSDAVLTLTKELELAESQDQTEVAKNLAKKNKEWRTLAQKKEAEVHRLRAEVKRLTDGGTIEKASVKEKTKDEKDIEIDQLKAQTKEWKDRYKTISMSHIDFRKQLTALKSQTLKAKKLLIEEIGDEKIVEELMDTKGDKGPPKWRGRAQQILMLQSKVRDLKKKLEMSPGSTRSSSSSSKKSENKLNLR